MNKETMRVKINQEIKDLVDNKSRRAENCHQQGLKDNDIITTDEYEKILKEYLYLTKKLESESTYKDLISENDKLKIYLNAIRETRKPEVERKLNMYKSNGWIISSPSESVIMEDCNLNNVETLTLKRLINVSGVNYEIFLERNTDKRLCGYEDCFHLLNPTILWTMSISDIDTIIYIPPFKSLTSTVDKRSEDEMFQIYNYVVKNCMRSVIHELHNRKKDKTGQLVLFCKELDEKYDIYTKTPTSIIDKK